MSKSIKVIRTFPRAWYKFIVEGEVNSLPKSERLIAESALSKAFPDGGDIIATKMDKGFQKFSSLVCESYSVNGLKDKTEGKTFKVKVLASAEKNPKTFKKYVSEGIEDLRKKRRETDFDSDDSGMDQESDLAMVSRLASGSPDYADSGDLAAIAHSYDEWKKLFGTSLIGRRSSFGGAGLADGDEKGSGAKDAKGGTPKGEEGIPTENLRQGAKHLKEEIVKAFNADDKDRLVELRAVLPVMAVDISKGFIVSRLVGEFSTEAGAGGKSETEFSASVAHAMIQSLAVVYNDAFGLPNDNPFAEKVDDKSDAKVYTDVKEILGDSAKAYNELKKNFKDKKISRADYATDVIDDVFYGERYAEKMVKDVTGADDSVFSNKARVERSEIRRSVKTLNDWVTKNGREYGVTGGIEQRKVNMSESDYEYAKIQALLDSMRNWVGQIDDAFTMIDAIDGDLTIDNVTNAYKDQASRVGESVVTEAEQTPEERPDRLALLAQILKKVWEDRGLSEDEPYNGDLEELKDSVNGACEAQLNRVNEISSSLRRDFTDYKDQYRKHLRDIRAGKVAKGRSKPFNFDFEKSPTFTDGENSGDYMKSKKDMTPNANMEWLRANVCSNRWRNLQMVKNQMQKQLDSSVDAKAQINQMSQAQSDFLQSGERPVKSSGDSGYTPDEIAADPSVLDDEVDSGEVTKADREIDDVTQGVEDDPDKKEVRSRKAQWDEMSDDFVGCEPVDVRQRAKFLHLNPDRALKIHDWWCKVVTCPGGLPEYLGFLADGRNSKDAKRFNDIRKEIQDEIDKQEGYKDAIARAKAALKDANAALKEDQDKLARLDAENVADGDKAGDNGKEVQKDDVDKMLADEERTKLVDSITTLKKVIKELRKEVNNPTGDGLKRLSRHEKDLIATRIIGPTDMTSPLETYGTQDEIEHHARGISHDALRLGGDTRKALIKDELSQFGAWSNSDEEVDTDKLDDSRYQDYLMRNNTYRGYPDLLLLLAYEQIVDEVYANEKAKEADRRLKKNKTATQTEKSFEDCIFDTVDPLFVSYQRFLVRKLKLENIAELGNVIEAVSDKYLVTVDALLDMIEKSDVDAQKKLDMLEVVETGFTAWCDQNGVVPQAVNPADDEDAVANHPEDEEPSEDDSEA